jgi:hypothetical protein
MDDHNKGPNQQSKEFIPYGANYWDRIIACRVPSLQGRREKYIDVNEQKDPFLISLFGSKRPGADQYLLHFAPGWDSNRNPVRPPGHGPAQTPTVLPIYWGRGRSVCSSG